MKRSLDLEHHQRIQDRSPARREAAVNDGLLLGIGNILLGDAYYSAQEFNGRNTLISKVSRPPSFDKFNIRAEDVKRVQLKRWNTSFRSVVGPAVRPR